MEYNPATGSGDETMDLYVLLCQSLYLIAAPWRAWVGGARKPRVEATAHTLEPAARLTSLLALAFSSRYKSQAKQIFKKLTPRSVRQALLAV